MKKLFLILPILTACGGGGIEPTLRENNITDTAYCDCLVDNHPAMANYTSATKAQLKTECALSPTHATLNATRLPYGGAFNMNQDNATVARMCAGIKLSK
jgi:hypothetical protein